MIKTRGVVHFSLPVTDIEKSTAFYTKVLGMEISEKRKNIVFPRTGNDHFMLTKSDDPIKPSAGDAPVQGGQLHPAQDRQRRFTDDRPRLDPSVSFQQARRRHDLPRRRSPVAAITADHPGGEKRQPPIIRHPRTPCDACPMDAHRA